MTCITKQTLTLLNKINAVDPMAALSYMDMLIENSKSDDLMLNPVANSLSSAFVWSETKQKHDYWSVIHRSTIK